MTLIETFINGDRNATVSAWNLTSDCYPCSYNIMKNNNHVLYRVRKLNCIQDSDQVHRQLPLLHK